MDDKWIDGARALAAEIGETILKAGGTLADSIVVVTDQYEPVGFDLSVELLMVGRRSRTEAERVVRTNMARALAAGELGASASVLTRSAAMEKLAEKGLVADAAFFEEEVPSGSVRMIALRGDEWRLEQLGI